MTQEKLEKIVREMAEQFNQLEKRVEALEHDLTELGVLPQVQ
jgi:hypothetical protein